MPDYFLPHIVRTPPLFAPPAGYRWELRENVHIFEDHSGVDSGGLAIPPTAGGRQTRTHGANYGLPGDAAHELCRWTGADIQLYEKRVGGSDLPTDRMHVQQGESSGATYVLVQAADMRRYYSSSPAVWPETFEITYTVPAAPPDATIEALGAVVTDWIGDVWAAVPTSSKLTKLNPAVFDTAKQGFRIDWTRTEHREDVALHTLVVPYELTWPRMLASPKVYLLGGIRVEVTAIPSGGYRTQWLRGFEKLPGTDGTGGGGPGGGTTGVQWFVVDVTPVDDPDYPIY